MPVLLFKSVDAVLEEQDDMNFIKKEAMFKNIFHPNNEPMSTFKAYFEIIENTKRAPDMNRGKNLYLYTTLKLVSFGISK